MWLFVLRCQNEILTECYDGHKAMFYWGSLVSFMSAFIWGERFLIWNMNVSQKKSMNSHNVSKLQPRNKPILPPNSPETKKQFWNWNLSCTYIIPHISNIDQFSSSWPFNVFVLSSQWLVQPFNSPSCSYTNQRLVEIAFRRICYWRTLNEIFQWPLLIKKNYLHL